MQYWLFKSEPNCYSIDDMKRDKKTLWDGVRNYQARNFMREMRVGDRGLFYHSSTIPAGVVGTVVVSKNALPDLTQFDPKSDHPDPKSNPADPRWDCVELTFDTMLSRTVTLNEIKQKKAFSHLQLVQKGNRLSVLPVDKKHYDQIIKMAQ